MKNKILIILTLFIIFATDVMAKETKMVTGYVDFNEIPGTNLNVLSARDKRSPLIVNANGTFGPIEISNKAPQIIILNQGKNILRGLITVNPATTQIVFNAETITLERFSLDGVLAEDNLMQELKQQSCFSHTVNLYWIKLKNLNYEDAITAPEVLSATSECFKAWINNSKIIPDTEKANLIEYAQGGFDMMVLMARDNANPEHKKDYPETQFEKDFAARLQENKLEQ